MRSDITCSFFAASKHAFLPPQIEQRRRSHYIQNALAANLYRSDIAPKLLPEIWHMIAGYMTRYCAAITTQELEHVYPKVIDHELDLRRPIYASYLKIDGNIYVRDLLHAAPTIDSGTQTCLYMPSSKLSNPLRADIYIAQDHLGIRRIVFLASTDRKVWCDNQNLVPGVWWRRLSDVNTFATIHIQGDGLKVRQVEGSSEQVLRDPLAQLLWQAPLAYSPGLISIVTLGTPIPWPSRRRMKFFECNHPDAAGYLVTCTGFEVYDIAVHKRDEKPHVNLCEDMPYRHLHWMYMPLDVGEHITHISRQLDHDGEFRMVRTGLTFTTNKGRNTVFGAYATQADEVFKMPRNMTKVYFNWWDNPGVHAGLEYVALEPTAQPKEAVLYEAPELPIALGVHCRKPLSMDADSMLFG